MRHSSTVCHAVSFCYLNVVLSVGYFSETVVGVLVIRVYWTRIPIGLE